MKADPKLKQPGAFLGDETGLLGVLLTGAPPKARVTVRVRENALMEASTFTGALPAAKGAVTIAPKISYKFPALRDVKQQAPLNVTFAVEVDGKPLGEQIETVNVHAINDCVYGFAETEAALPDMTTEKKSSKTTSKKKAAAKAGYTDLSWMFAAYVNESHPLIDTILKEALDTKIVTGFDDYQSGERTDILRQVFAIWHALQARGIRYSNTTAVPGGSRLVLSQNVRFMEEAARAGQANCVDGSVMLASILRRVELDPFLVLVPGHMYVGVYLDGNDKSERAVAIDTTALGDVDAAHGVKVSRDLKVLNTQLTKTQHDDAWETFKAAIADSTEDLREHRKKFESGDDPQYQIIDIEGVRDEGVMPIPYVKSE